MIRFNIVDGGYLTYVYGSMWGQGSWPPDYIRDALIMMDDFHTIREEIDPSYKSERRARRAANPDKAKQHLKIRKFRESVRQDPRMTFVKVKGLEADDTVVLATWRWRQELKVKPKVLGIDKDLLQARGIKLYDHKGQRIKLAGFQKRLPKTLQSNRLRASQIPLVLSLLGDKSDSIPRLLPPRELGILWRLLWDQDRTDWKGAYDHFGRAFLNNLYATILPHPTCFGYSPEDTLEVVEAGQWTSGQLKELTAVMNEEVYSWPLEILQKASKKKRKPLDNRYVELGKDL